MILRARVDRARAVDLLGEHDARQMVRERRIPLNLSYEPTPNEQTLAAIHEAEEIAQTGRQRFKNADEMFDSLEI